MKVFSLKEAAILTVSAVLCMLVIEASTRVYYLHKDKKNNVSKPDPVLGWDFTGSRKEPFPLNFNDVGIREGISKNEILKQDKTIVFLGNSVVMAQHVLPSDTFVKKVQGLLKGVYAINAGFDGYELHRELKKFNRDLSDLKNIDTLVWVPNINDFKTEDSITGLLEETARLHQQEWGTLAGNFFSDVPKGHLFEKASASFQSYIANFKSQSKEVTFTPKDFYYSQGLIEEPAPETLRFVDTDVQKLKEQLSLKGVKLWGVFLPSRQFSAEKGWSDAKSFHRLASILEKYQIPYIQLLDLFHEQKHPESLFSDYIHLNEKGHELTALGIVESGIFDHLKPLDTKSLGRRKPLRLSGYIN